jgi:PAS domain S-box-containing protein
MPDPSLEDALRVEAQARLAAIVESSDDAIVSKTLEGVITSWNRGAERMFGYTPTEAVGRHISLIIPPERLNEEPQILAQLQAGLRVDHFETVRVRKDGRLVEISVTISPVRAADGRIIGASKIARDITEQKRIERELRAAKRAAEEASRAKDHFLSVLSHELRTPLTPALGAICHLLDGPEMSADDARPMLEMVRRNIEVEARLVDDLLDVTRIARGKVQMHFEVVDAHDVVHSVVSMLGHEVEDKQQKLRVDLHASDAHVWADPSRLRQVFLNLLSNAIKFTPNHGEILIRSSNIGGTWTADVIDNGVGIAADVLPRLFSAFEQGEQTIARRFGGLGLGLSIVNSLLELHGGHVTAHSDGPGRGATFVIDVPTMAALNVPRPAERRRPSTALRPGQRILLVEDHADTRKVMGRLLSSFGFDVSTAGTMREALELAERMQFDLLVSDIGLPDGSGTDLMRQLAKRHQIRGIALSGFGQDDDVRRSTEAGFEKHLIKPVNLTTLREVIMNAAAV